MATSEVSGVKAAVINSWGLGQLRRNLRDRESKFKEQGGVRTLGGFRLEVLSNMDFIFTQSWGKWGRVCLICS